MPRRVLPLALLTVLILSPASVVRAEAPSSPEARERLAAAIPQRLLRAVGPEKILTLEPREVPALLTPAERELLSSGHVAFRVNIPTIVSVIRTTASAGEPFWLDDRRFERTDLRFEVGEHTYEAWERRFDAGPVSLGISSFSGKHYPYFVALKPVNADNALEVTDLYPKRLKLGTLADEAEPLVDRRITVAGLPSELDGQVMIRTSRSWSRDAAPLEQFLKTKHPASAKPDHVVLTWSDDPRTTITIQWRTGAKTSQGRVQYREKATGGGAAAAAAMRRVAARTQPLETPMIVNDPLIHLHAATLTRLKPGTTYEYRLDDQKEDWREFTTAPARPASFTFTYMGDAQNGLDEWGKLLHESFRKYPESAFYILAGDLVNRGHDRDDWDSFFHNAEGVFDRRVFVPVIGNHEVLGGKPPTLYLSFFQLPQAGPVSIDPERAYAFEYGNALFVILDSNLDPKLQTTWLEEQLARSSAKWKFVSFHHPVYASHPERNHDHLLNAWGPLFDKYGVDMVLQGHDHAYLRTHPMYAGASTTQPTTRDASSSATTTKRGTYYVVSVSGTKFYPQADHDYAAVAFTEVPTYQVIRITVEQDRLYYRALDKSGAVRDELVIDKPTLRS